MELDYHLTPEAICRKNGILYLHREEDKILKKYFCSVFKNDFIFGNSLKSESDKTVINILGGSVQLLELKLMNMTGIEISVVPNISSTILMTSADIKSRPKNAHYCFYTESADDAIDWLSYLLRLESEFNGSDEQLSIINSSPKIKDLSPVNRRALLWQKLRLCALHFDFSNADESCYRDVKLSVLQEVLEIVNLFPSLVSDSFIFMEIIKCLELSLFRNQPTEADEYMSEMNEDDEIQYADPEWTHLCVCYQILVHIILSNQIDPFIYKHVISNAFVTNLVGLLNSIDKRERDYLKNIIHRIYSKLTNRRTAIRKAIYNTFFEFLYENSSHHGIQELLEILASIVNGFTVPMRSEHKKSLVMGLIPLHKMPQYEQYSVQLSYCMSVYMNKDRSLCIPIFRGLLKYWPYGNSKKEILFLNELEDLMDSLSPSDLIPFRTRLYNRLNRCINSSNTVVVERALFLWNSESFDTIILSDCENFRVLCPIIYPTLRKVYETHFVLSVRKMALHVIGLIGESDYQMVERLSRDYEVKS